MHFQMNVKTPVLSGQQLCDRGIENASAIPSPPQVSYQTNFFKQIN